MPLFEYLLKANKNFLKLIALLLVTMFPLNKRHNKYKPFLSWTINRDVVFPCLITLPNAKVFCIIYKTCISRVSCTITKCRSPRLVIINDPSPSVKPINQVNQLWLKQGDLPTIDLYFS